jgi:hypothetical protein
MTPPTLHLIQHGENDKSSVTDADEDGLSTSGLSRAQQLVQVFSLIRQYHIGCILAQHLKKSNTPGAHHVLLTSLKRI